MLDKEFQWYRAHQEKLVKQYNGKILLIHNCQVEGAFSDNYSAYVAGVEKYGEGNFLMQKCTPGPEAYTFTYHSRVRIPANGNGAHKE